MLGQRRDSITTIDNRNRFGRQHEHTETPAHLVGTGVVGNDQVREPCWTRASPVSTSLRYYEPMAPRDVAWWWDTVIGMPRPSKPLNSPITAFANHGEYLDSIYNQGARYLDMLRARLAQ